MQTWGHELFLKLFFGALEQYSDSHRTADVPTTDTTTLSFSFKLCTFPQFFVSAQQVGRHAAPEGCTIIR